MPSRRYTDEEEKKICDQYCLEIKTSVIAEEFKTSRETIRNILIRNGMQMRPGAGVAEDLRNKKFSKLKVLRRAKKNIDGTNFPKGKVYWWCKCDCGNPEEILVLANRLKSGKTRSCGCLRKESSAKKVIDETGKQYGKLTVICRGSRYITKHGGKTTHAAWYCQCNCGNPEQVLVEGSALRQGRVTSCGCDDIQKRRDAYNKTNSLENRLYSHKKKLDFYGKVELVGKYINETTKTNYRCMLHGEIHPALPSNVVRGKGLVCCSGGGWDSFQAIMKGTFRCPERECWLYLFHMANYPELIKYGIASYLDLRPDEEYGELITSWYFDSRLDACLLEMSLKNIVKEKKYSFQPKELNNWGGKSELVTTDKYQLIEEIQYLIDRYLELGKWQFALEYIPLGNLERQYVEKHLSNK